MPPVDRKNPKRAASSESQYSVMEFIREFPNDEACLNYLWRERYSPDGEHAYCPRCQIARRFRRYEGKRARHVWKCTSCTQELSPTAGTIFHKSSTSLHLWFYAMWIMTSTRCGVSAKQLERELGVTYKTAWRMFNLIRNKLMEQDYQGPLSGEVEADETFVGGKPRNSDRRKYERLGWDKRTGAWEKKAVVFGAVERGGKVRATVLPNSGGHHVRNAVREYVVPETVLYTDEYAGYSRLGERFVHHTIRHRDRIYVDGDVHTQTIEGFWSLTKNGIRGVYHNVSRKWLQGYLNEYAWRYNHRDDPRAMFRLLLHRATVS
ncbi:MAG TPA: IS1595 family transposase [Gaiellaceae bacterium]|nr:IS1595 family transposase [Gaiellaceae bacterium]